MMSQMIKLDLKIEEILGKAWAPWACLTSFQKAKQESTKPQQRSQKTFSKTPLGFYSKEKCSTKPSGCKTCWAFSKRLVHQRFTPNSFYRILWHGNFYTQNLQNLLTPEGSCNIFSQEDLHTKHFYIRKLARQTSPTPETLYTEEPLHKNPVTSETFCNRDSLQQELLNHKTFKEIVYTKQLCYPNK